MKIIEPDATIIHESNVYKQVERIGRLCYKSEGNISRASCYSFVENLVEHKHFAMLEHGHVHFIVTLGGKQDRLPDSFIKIPYVVWDELPLNDDGEGLTKNYLVTVSLSHLYKDTDCSPLMRDLGIAHSRGCYTSEDYIISMIKLDQLGIQKVARWYKSKYGHPKYIKIFTSMLMRHAFISVKFTCDRGVSHELVRHRCSVAQESTRYCNYARDKFGNELTFIRPSNMDAEDIANVWEPECESIEDRYIYLVKKRNVAPQIARSILPNSLKTEVVLTMSLQQWDHFFNVRLWGTTGKPHPDMVVVAQIAHDKIVKFNDNLFGVLNHNK